jgi:hypothetical protein
LEKGQKNLFCIFHLFVPKPIMMIPIGDKLPTYLLAANVFNTFREYLISRWLIGALNPGSSANQRSFLIGSMPATWQQDWTFG